MKGLSEERYVLMSRAMMAAPVSNHKLAWVKPAWCNSAGAMQALHKLPELIQHPGFLLWKWRLCQYLHCSWYATYQNKNHSDVPTCTLIIEVTDSSTELRWASFCLKYSDLMYFEPGWKEKRYVNSLPTGLPQLGSAFFPWWAVTWLLIPFSPKFFASGYRSRTCLAYFVEGLFRDSIFPLALPHCVVWLMYLKKHAIAFTY